MKLPGWLAALPAFLIVTLFALRAFVQVGHASRAVTDDGFAVPRSRTCVETYSTNLANSEYFVPEGQQFLPRKTPEISTVLSGMVRNNCDEPLKQVIIHFKVSDDSGKRGEGATTVSDLNVGEAKPFSRAWMGRVTSYEVVKIQ